MRTQSHNHTHACTFTTTHLQELRGHLLYFEKLFTLYLAHRKTNSVVWNRIQPLRPENVSSSYIYMYMYMLGAKFGFGPSAYCIARASDPSLAQSIQGLSPSSTSTLCALSIRGSHLCACAIPRHRDALTFTRGKKAGSKTIRVPETKHTRPGWIRIGS